MRRIALALVLVALAATLAAAQGTGGVMGGGDWGAPSSSSSSSSSWSSSSGWSSSSSSDSSSSWSSSSSHKSSWSWSSSKHDDHDDYSYSSSHYVPTDYPPIDWSGPRKVFFVLGIGITALVVLGLMWRSFKDSFSRPRPSPALAEFGDPGTLGVAPPVMRAPPGSVDVTVLRVALDGRTRKFVQTELAQIAETSDTATTEGRVAMLAQVTLLLRRVRDAWVYGGAHNEPMSRIEVAKGVFDRHVDDARTAFMHETIANVQGQRSRTAAPDISPRGDEGAGLILVSIILAARAELYHVSRIGDGEDLRKALEATSYLTTNELVAVEIVWMPSEDSDRMSSLELEAKYPRPLLIPIRGALVGKAFCTYCAGPFPAELVSCPHCGAPAPGRDRSAA